MNRARPFVVTAGITLAVVAIATNDHRVAWVAIAALVAAVVLRVVARRQSRSS